MRSVAAGLLSLALSAFACCAENITPGQTGADKLPASYFAEMAEVKRHYQLFDEASALLRQAIALSTSEADKLTFQTALAETLEAAGQAPEAAALWESLARNGNPAVAARAKLALAYRLAAEQKTAAAIVYLEEVSLHCPIQNYRAAAAAQLAKLANKQEKLEQYLALLRKEPANRELLNLVLALQQDDPKARMNTLAEVYAADKHDLDIIQRYGVSLIEAGELDQAGKFYRGLATDYPSLQQLACEQLARLSSRQGATEEAVKLVLRSASAMPDDVEKALYLTRHFLELNLPQEAEQYGRLAHERSAGEAMKAAADMEWGEALYRLNNFAAAAQLLRPIAEQSLWRGLQIRAQNILADIDKSQQPK